MTTDEELRIIVWLLGEMMNFGCRVCSPEERRDSANVAYKMIETLKEYHGLPAGRGDTR